MTGRGVPRRGPTVVVLTDLLPESLQHDREISWELASERVVEAIVRGAQAQQARVQKLAAQASQRCAGAVGGVTGHRMTDRRKVHAQLMRAAREQQGFDQRPA